MNIGELYISLGITGGDKASETLKNLQKALEGIQQFKMPHIASTPIKLPEVETKHAFWSGFQKNIGEAKKSLGSFFKLKPDDKTPKALEQTEGSLKKISSMSLEAKAAIVGAVYALDRLFSMTGAQGTGILNTASLLNGDVDTLQRYQYVAKMAGSTNEELDGTFVSLSNSMSKLTTTAVAPEFWGQLQVGLRKQFSAADVRDFTTHPEKLLQELQVYAQIQKNIGVRNQVLESFVGKTMAALLIRRKFTPDSLSHAPTYSDRDLNALDKSREKWAHVNESISRMFGRLNVRFGAKLADDIQKIIPHVEKLVTAFSKFAEKIHAFEIIDSIIKGWTMIFDTVAKGVDSLNTLLTSDNKKEKDKILSNVPSASEAASIAGQYFELINDKLLTTALKLSGKTPKEADSILSGAKRDVDLLLNLIKNATTFTLPSSDHPYTKPRTIGKTTENKTYHVNQNLHFLTKEHNPNEVAQILKREYTNTLLNLSSITQNG